MPITLNEHRAGVTNSVIAVYSDDASPQLGFSAFFPPVTSPTLEVTVEVERNGQPIAVDVQRARGSNRNIFDRSTEHIYIPPFHSEKFDFTALQAYDKVFSEGSNPSAGNAQVLISSASKKVMAMKNKILRAIEKQRVDVCQTGIVTMLNGDSINFNRQSASMTVLSGSALWSAITTADPAANLVTGADFLRQVGLSAGTTINVVMGGAAFSNFMKNANIQKEAAIFSQIKRVNIGMPQFDNTTGFVFQGQYGNSDYIFNLWTYNAWYKNSSNAIVKYLNTNNVVMLPDDFEGVTAFGAIPMVMGDAVTGQFVQPQEGDFFFHDLIDMEKKTWDFILEAAPVAVAVSIDRIYTLTVN
jgi:hypothetical protein